MSDKVVIIGGGVAGLSAAHELLERGFEVEVYEKKLAWGGKSRTIPVPDTGADPGSSLPGEHGFRFFPGFYRNVVDTMERIPYADQARGVAANLTFVQLTDISRFGRRPILLPAGRPTSVTELRDAVAALIGITRASQLAAGEIEYFCERLWQMATSCPDRRLEEYEPLSWWDYIGAATRSRAYRALLAAGLTRSIVAATPQQASAKSVGEVLLQLIYGWIEPGVGVDRVLCGPTSEVWIDPWVEYLGRKAKLTLGWELESLNVSGRRITSATFRRQDGTKTDVAGKYFILAVPVDVVGGLLQKPEQSKLLALDPHLNRLTQLANDVAWMNGVQYFLKRDVRVAPGHCLYVDSPWAITSISPAQFWRSTRLEKRGNGTVKGMISVDISDWNSPGLSGRTARASKPAEVIAEVWEELKLGINNSGPDVLVDDDCVMAFLDPDISPATDAAGKGASDLEPLFLALAGRWHLRPDATTRVPNFFLAGDYVRTSVQLPTMEGANEAARRAVNGLLRESRSDADSCRVWDLREPELLAPLRAYDQLRFCLGLDWAEDPTRYIPFRAEGGRLIQDLYRVRRRVFGF